ncbi:alpha/beta-hydrolase [Neoconidiobolus thromboides FSU 785]|nr:alpha/beta-hydrolase [Neoconidiobolus thromboides FSU 785]
MRNQLKNKLSHQLKTLVNFYQRDRWLIAQQTELKILNTVYELQKINNNQAITLNNDQPVQLYNQKVDDGEFIHTLSIKTNNTKNIVMLHGFGVGLGIYMKNMGALCQLSSNYNLHYLDWLGMGLSSRPDLLNSFKDGVDITYKAEDFFINGLEAWRKNKNIDKLQLVGHSLGGYLASLYSMRYPERVDKLILLSPVGIPEKPAVKPDTRHRATAPKWINWLWDRHMTPQKIVRSLGPYGESLVLRYIMGRFPNLPENEQALLKEYLFDIAALPGSGEYALGSILQAGAYARYPLKYRLTNIHIPITFVYGDRDWMNPDHAYKLITSLPDGSNLKIVPNAGHQLFLDNPTYFNSLLINEFS